MHLDNLSQDYRYITKTGIELSKYQIIDCMLDLDETLMKTYYLKEEYRDFNLTTDNPEEISETLEEII